MDPNAPKPRTAPPQTTVSPNPPASSSSSLLKIMFRALQNQVAPLVSVKAGKCSREGTLVKPDLRKGLLYLQVTEDTLLHLFWKDRSTNVVEEDLIIFPEEAEFIKVQQTSGRVYVLKFKSSSQRLFFWFQDINADKDAEIVTRINHLINNPPANNESAALESIMSSMLSSKPKSTEGEPAATQASSSGAAVNSEQLAQLRSILANVKVPEQSDDIDLSSVITPEAVQPLLQDPAVASALFPHLPEGANRTVEEIKDTIRSPQFKSAVRSLTAALRSGQLGPVLQQLGIDSSSSGHLTGVRAFLKALQGATGVTDNEHRLTHKLNHVEHVDKEQGDHMDQD